nr:DNA helicase [Tanacetum cinerariifolium]
MKTKRRLAPKSVGSSSGPLPVEHSVVAQGCGLWTIHSHTPFVRPTVSTLCVRQLDASLDIRRLNELKQNVIDQDHHQVNLPSKKTCVCLSNSFPCIHQQSVNPVNVNTSSTPIDDHDDHGHNGLHMYPHYMKLLLQDRYFLEIIRAYNKMFSMTSLGSQVDDSVNNGRGPYIYKISGQLYHWIGSLCPIEGEPPRTTREKFQDTHVPNFKVRLYNVVGAREYKLPTGDMLGAIVYETGPESDMDYDIVLEERSGEPAVQILFVHLMNMQRVVFRDQDGLNSIVVDTHKKMTNLTEWLHYNEWNTDGRHLTYLDFPSEFVWYADGKYWRRRHVRTKSSIGRLTYVHPAAGDLFYQRMLLCHQKGYYVLYELENCLNHYSKSLADFGLRMPPERLMPVLKNRLLMEEKNYDRTLLAAHRDYLRFEGKIVLVIASSGIASLLLPAGRTTHSRFKIPLDLTDNTNGNIGTHDECDPENYSWVDIPKHYGIPDDGNGISNLIKFIYNNETLRYPSATKLQDKAIVCPKNDTTDIINNKILSLLLGRAYTYLSYDEAIPHGHDGGEVELLYPKEYLNTLFFPGLPPHSHGQLYVALSRETTPDGLKVLISRQPNRSPTTTKNIVYKDFLSGFDLQQINGNNYHFQKHIRRKGQNDNNKAQCHHYSRPEAKDTNKTIEAVVGNTISLALWHDMAVNFNLQEYEALERPVAIAVSSCWVRRYHGLQLSSTSATHYYLNPNPNIPKTFHIKQVHQQLLEPQVMLNIENQRYENSKEEKIRNRFPLATIFDLDPQNYKITSHSRRSISYMQKSWTSAYSSIINDGTATMSLTCFSNNANTLIKDCDDILAELLDKDQYKLPSALKELEGTTHVISLEPIVEEQLRASQVPKPTAAPISEHQAEAIQHAKPLSPASSTPASNQPEVVEPEPAATKEPQSTPPTIPETVKPIKGDQQTNLPNTSARKSLFRTEPEADTSKRTKKAKHDK